jgi:PhnB protein
MGSADMATAFLYVYVEDVDATYVKALAARAVSLEAPADMPYGDRRAMVKEPFRQHLADRHASARPSLG